MVNCAAGYRISWNSARGCVLGEHYENNEKRWSGDHIVDPTLVPGVLFMNRAFEKRKADLRDLAPTILAALGAPPAPAMEGSSLFEASNGRQSPAAIAGSSPPAEKAATGDVEEDSEEAERLIRERLSGLGYL